MKIMNKVMAVFMAAALVSQSCKDAPPKSAPQTNGAKPTPTNTVTKEALDLRPAVDFIISFIDKRRAQMPADQNLIVLMGQNHTMPAHITLAQMVIARLEERLENFIVTFEQPHNYWSVIASNNMDLHIPQGLYYTANQYDPDGRAAISAMMGFRHPKGATLSYMNIMAFCYHRGITTVFNDAADAAGQPILDLQDPATAAAAHEYYKENGMKFDPKAAIDPLKPDGISIRNRVMAKLALQQAEKLKARIILQITGQDHIFGDFEYDRNEFKNSLYATLEKSDVSVLPVFIMNSQDPNVKNIPPEARPELIKGIIINGLDEIMVITSAENAAREAELLQIMSTANGGKFEVFEIITRGQEWQQTARTDAQNLLDSYNAIHSP